MDENFLTRITQVANPSYMTPSAPRAPAAPTERPREKISTVDMIGGILDAFATLGGSEPGYRPTVDARIARERQAESDQMARQLFPVELQKGQLDNQESQRKMLGQTFALLSRARQNGGVEGARNMFNHIGQRLMTPEQLASETPIFEADPDAYISYLGDMAGSGDSDRFSGTPFVTEGPNGPKAYFWGKNGELKEAQLPPGEQPQSPIKTIDNGNENIVVDNRTGAILGRYPKGGTPSADQVPVTRPDGSTGYAPVPNSTLDRENRKAADQDVRQLEGLSISFDQGKAAMQRARNGLELMKKSNVIRDTSPDSQQSMGDRAKIELYRALPSVENVANPEGAKGRQLLIDAGRDIILSFEAAKKEAAGTGTSMSAQLINTIPEVQNRIDAVVNANDYESSKAALDAYEQVANKFYGLLQQHLASAKQRQQTGGQRGTGGDMPSISDDAGYQALPPGTTYRAPDGSIRQKKN